MTEQMERAEAGRAREVEGEEEARAHDTSIFWVKAPPARLRAGNDLKLRIGVSCASACDLEGKTVKVVAEDAPVVDGIELVACDSDEAGNVTGEISIQAPLVPGQYTWIAVFPAEEKKGVLHREASAPSSFVVEPHAVGLTVWDIPAPTVVGSRFTVKLGAKCLDGCHLKGDEVEVYDHKGHKVATASLGEAPYSDQVDLHWTEIELAAPDQEGYYRWEARFPESDTELSHQDASHTFGFSTVGPSEHEITVEVVDKETGSPLEGAHVLLRPKLYRAYTDEQGVAKLQLAEGEYTLSVSKREKAPEGVKYLCGGVPVVTCGRENKVYVPEDSRDSMEPFRTTIEVDSDLDMEIALVGVIEPLEEDTF